MDFKSCSTSLSSIKLSSDESPSLVSSSLGWYSALDSTQVCSGFLFSGEMTALFANNVDNVGSPSDCSLALFLMNVLRRDTSIGCSGRSKTSTDVNTNYYVHKCNNKLLFLLSLHQYGNKIYTWKHKDLIRLCLDAQYLENHSIKKPQY